MTDATEQPVSLGLGKALAALLQTAAAPPDPVEVIADTYAIIALLDEKSNSDPEAAQNVLLSCWMGFSGRELITLLQRKTYESVLHEYFAHRGDWSAIKTCLSKSVREHVPERLREWEEKVAKSSETVRKEFRELFGRGDAHR